MALDLETKGLLDAVLPEERVTAAGLFVIPLTLTLKDLVGWSGVAVAPPVLEPMEEGVSTALFVARPDRVARMVEVAVKVNTPVLVPLKVPWVVDVGAGAEAV